MGVFAIYVAVVTNVHSPHAGRVARDIGVGVVKWAQKREGGGCPKRGVGKCATTPVREMTMMRLGTVERHRAGGASALRTMTDLSLASFPRIVREMAPLSRRSIAAVLDMVS